MILSFFFSYINLWVPGLTETWKWGGSVPEPCGPSGHVDPKMEDDERGHVMCRGE